MTDIHLAVPPNILRKTADDLKVKFPDITIRPHQTHSEMEAFFAQDFGDPEKTADLTLAAYPSALANCMAGVEGGIFQAMPEDLPKLCPYLARAGFTESTPFYRVVAVVTLVFIANRQVEPFPKSWRELCGQSLQDRVVIPPGETPAPALYAYYMGKIFPGNRPQGCPGSSSDTFTPADQCCRGPGPVCGRHGFSRLCPDLSLGERRHGLARRGCPDPAPSGVFKKRCPRYDQSGACLCDGARIPELSFFQRPFLRHSGGCAKV